jgi:deazaflavin-dependent oxidoreductase (nitroreductase family)
MPDTTPDHANHAGQQRSGDHAEHAGQAHPHRGGAARPVRAFRSRGWRVGNAMVSVLARAGIGPIWLLTTRGRKTGRPHTVPVVVVEQDGRRWLVAPYGAVSWVHNARAAGRVTLRRGRDRGEYAIAEVRRPGEAGPVLKRYVAVASRTRASFQASKDAPVAEFVAEAHRHPVFELTPLSKDAP